MASKSKNYSEKDIATNLLITLKHLKSEYNTFTQEASNETLYNEIDKVYECVSTQQRNVYEMMKQQGWYKMTADTAQNIEKAYTKFNDSKSELS